MNKSRHAYCIIAHTDYYCLSRLVELVDDERNDIFLLFDKKSSIRKMSLPETFNSRIFTLPESQLIDIQWGAVAAKSGIISAGICYSKALVSTKKS